jgi:hypothetical protein
MVWCKHCYDFLPEIAILCSENTPKKYTPKPAILLPQNWGKLFSAVALVNTGIALVLCQKKTHDVTIYNLLWVCFFQKWQISPTKQ